MQALALLNDPSYIEAAKAFANRIVAEGGDTTQSKLRWAMRQGVLREPAESEIEILTDIYRKHVADGGEDSERSAWTSIARVILNLHETITRS